MGELCQPEPFPRQLRTHLGALLVGAPLCLRMLVRAPPVGDHLVPQRGVRGSQRGTVRGIPARVPCDALQGSGGLMHRVGRGSHLVEQRGRQRIQRGSQRSAVARVRQRVQPLLLGGVAAALLRHLPAGLLHAGKQVGISVRELPHPVPRGLVHGRHRGTVRPGRVGAHLLQDLPRLLPQARRLAFQRSEPLFVGFDPLPGTGRPLHLRGRVQQARIHHQPVQLLLLGRELGRAVRERLLGSTGLLLQTGEPVGEIQGGERPWASSSAIRRTC